MPSPSFASVIGDAGMRGGAVALEEGHGPTHVTSWAGRAANHGCKTGTGAHKGGAKMRAKAATTPPSPFAPLPAPCSGQGSRCLKGTESVCTA